MCRNKHAQNRAIEDAKRRTPNVIRVYDTGDGYDLVGLVLLLDATTAQLRTVHADGSTSFFDEVKRWDDPSNREICDMFHLDSHFYRIA